MPSFIFTKLATYIGVGLIAVLGAVLLFVVISKNDTINDQARIIQGQGQRIEQLNRDLGTCRANRITLQSEISNQNAAIERLRAEGVQREANLARVRDQAANRERDLQSRITRIQNSNPQSCEEIDDLILETVNGR